MQTSFQRIAIVNRGEAAMRFIHAVREFNSEHDTSLRTIAFFTDPDRHAMFVREADEAVCLGAAQVKDAQRSVARFQAVRHPYVECVTPGEPRVFPPGPPESFKRPRYRKREMMTTLKKVLLVGTVVMAIATPVIGQVHKYFTPGSAWTVSMIRIDCCRPANVARSAREARR